MPLQGQTHFVKPLITRTIDEKQLTELKGSAPGLAQREFDHGAAPDDLPMERMLLVLKRSGEQETALGKLLDDQQDSSSASYHKWLTPEQFGQQFGASDEDIQSITSWLQSHGLQVNQITKGRTVIEFSGTAAQVQDAFHTQMHKFVVDGESYWANAGNLQIPTALVPAVAGPWSLHSFRKKPQLSITKQKFEALYKPGTRPEFTGSNGAHALFPGDYSVIYNINPVYQSGINGSGASIAIVARTDIDINDPVEFWNISGLSFGSTSTITNGPDPGIVSDGEQFEATLDLSWSGAIAPGATKQFVVSASTNSTDGVDLSELYIVEHNLADVMTESFGSCEGFFTQQEADGVATLAQQAAAQGITYIVSTGDSGASTCDRPSQSQATHPISVNLLASTPFNIAAGGTMFNENGQNSTFWNTTNTNTLASAKTYIRENVWNESCSTAQCGSNANLFATGGGVSTFFSKPSWQSGVQGIPSDGHRDIPDISLTAAGHDPYLLCFQRSCEPDAQNFIHFSGVSGTSASAPSFAGIMALIVQKTGSRQGQANYVLYRLAAVQTYSQCNGSSTTSSPSASCTFHDITAGNNAVPGQTTQQYQSTVGYDPATGLGSPNVANLVNNWNTVAFAATSTTLALSPTSSVTHGSIVNVNIGVSPTSGTGTATGDVSLLTSDGLGIEGFTLNAGSVSSITTDLPGGIYNVKAHYAGNGTFGASDSNLVLINVTPESSTTKLSLITVNQAGAPVPFTSGPYGSFIYPRADVAGQSGHGIPTGTAHFIAAPLDIGAWPLNSEGNTALPNGLYPSASNSIGPGTYQLQGIYSGDASFSSSTATPILFTITPAVTTTTMTASRTNIGHASTVTLAAKVAATSLAFPPDGFLTFFSGSTILGTTTVLSQNAPDGTVLSTGSLDTNLPIGVDSVSVTYQGNGRYAPSTSVPISVTVQADFSTSLTTSTATISAGQSASSRLAITGETGFNGTVTFACSNLPSKSSCNFNPATLPGTGTTTVTIATTAPVVAMAVPHVRPVYLAWWMLGGAPLIGLVVIGGTKQRRRDICLGIFLFVVLATSFGCGGGGGSGSGGRTIPGTPVGTYQVSITATSNGLNHQSTFALTVQQ